MEIMALKLLSVETFYRWESHAPIGSINFHELKYKGSQDGVEYAVWVRVDPDRGGEAMAGFVAGTGDWEHASSHESLRTRPAVVTAAMADALRRVAAMKQ